MESCVELFEILECLDQILSWRDQVGESEVVGALLLTEATSGNGQDSGRVNHLHTIEKINCHILLFGVLNCFRCEFH